MSPLIAGIHAALIRIVDPDPQLRLWQALGWSLLSSGRREAAPYGERGQVEAWVLGAPGARGGRVELLRFETDPPAGEARPSVLDQGPFAVDVYVRDMEGSAAACAEEGFHWGGGGPQDYRFATPSGATITVREGLVAGPDGLNLVMVKAGAPRPTEAWAADPDAATTELTSVVLSSFDLDAALGFWGPGGVGLELLYDVELAEPALTRMLGIPSGNRFRLAFLAGTSTARLELMSPLPQPQPGPAPSSHLRRGFFGCVIAVADLESAIQTVIGLGASVLNRDRGRAVVVPPGGGLVEVRPL